MRKKILLSGLLLTSSYCLINCSGVGSSSSGSSAAASSFAKILAEDMVLSSPTSQRTVRSLSNNRFKIIDGVQVLVAPDANDSAAEKKDALATLVSSTPPSSCAIAINLVSSSRANCYGPQVSWTNHEAGGPDSQWPGGDLGIWEAEEGSTNESCVASQLNNQMRGATSFIDMGQFVVAGMACVASKNSLTLPATASTSIDLTALMSGVVTVNSSAMTVTSASIGRDADVSGNPVFITTLSGTVGTKTINIRLKHMPTTADDSTNVGKISVKVSNSSPASTDGLSLEYEKVSSTSGRMLLKSINFNSAAQDPFVSGSNYTVSFAKSWNNNANFFSANINPVDYSGKFSYAWQAGNSDSHARVFNTIIASGGATGTGFFGFGPTVQTGAGSIAGMICAWTGPDQTHVPVSKVQRQDISLSSGKYDVSGTSLTVFDPVADCEAAGTMNMTWNSGASSRSVNDTTENLAPLADVTSVFGSQPTAPTAVE